MTVDLPSLSDYLDTDTPTEKGTILQRNLLNALLSALAVTALIGALLPLTVLASGNRSENCPPGFTHKSDPPQNLTTEWGTATMANGGSAVSFYVKDGYTVHVCVKGGNEGFDTETIVGEKTVVVATPTDQAVSHYEWSFSTTPTTSTSQPTTTTTEGSTTSSSQPTATTTTDPTTTSTVASSTTSTSSPATTTSTTEPSTTSTTQSSSSTTSSDEVLDSTLPFTGSPTSGLSTLALSLLSAGILILLATKEGRSWSSK